MDTTPDLLPDRFDSYGHRFPTLRIGHTADNYNAETVYDRDSVSYVRSLTSRCGIWREAGPTADQSSERCAMCDENAYAVLAAHLDNGATIAPAPIGPVFTIPLGAMSVADSARGGRALQHYGRHRSLSHFEDVNALTMADVLAAVTERETETDSVVSAVSARLRTITRYRGWEDVYEDVMGTATPQHYIWRHDFARPIVADVESVDSPLLVADVVRRRMPTDVRLLPTGTTFAHLFGYWLELDSVVHADLSALASALLSEADSRDWCSEYESSIDEVNRECGRFGYPFQPREREREYAVDWSVTITGTAIVMASSEDDASEGFDADSYIDRGTLWDRFSAYDVNVDGVSEA